MLEMSDVLLNSFQVFLANPLNLAITLSSAAFATAFFYASAKSNCNSLKKKIAFAYAGLAFAFLPLELIAFSATCYQMGFDCAVILYKMFALFTPLAIATAFAASAILMPALIAWTSKGREIREGWIHEFVKKQGEKTGVKNARVYCLDSQKPTAFSFKSLGFQPSVFLSIGLLDVLTKNEVKAVLLHELAHLKKGDSVLKASTQALKLFLPFNAAKTFSHSFLRGLNAEEKAADEFACSVQGTNKFLKNAKAKLAEFDQGSTLAAKNLI